MSLFPRGDGGGGGGEEEEETGRWKTTARPRQFDFARSESREVAEKKGVQPGKKASTKKATKRTRQRRGEGEVAETERWIKREKEGLRGRGTDRKRNERIEKGWDRDEGETRRICVAGAARCKCCPARKNGYSFSNVPDAHAHFPAERMVRGWRRGEGRFRARGVRGRA